MMYLCTYVHMYLLVYYIAYFRVFFLLLRERKNKLPTLKILASAYFFKVGNHP